MPQIATPRPDTRARILDAAMRVLRTRGYEGSSVDDICAAAGVTKGAFFHHFRSKEDLAVAAAAHFSIWLEALFDRLAWRDHADPRDRLLAYIDARIAILRGDIAHFTCLLGALVQDSYATRPAVRAACEDGIRHHAAGLESDIAAAMDRHGVGGFTPEGLALHIVAVIQGAFVMAKATGGPDLAVDTLRHLRRYIEMLFRETAP
ncbi:TetR/AcrR family transcriptional regulator [Roseomonas sp. PWR1]|uniref:TetR/AcrR family transcriptional regulator n=1 Tax=Roseomonas nitratireducens TaxID=2820810 RepID=A0ABS4ARB7_9PROT|nr:TetR/AcrR family transcriptional regulator [Neoroseomonas nitratireducens]MBP0463891.1 TetR/AcrR family transcriptional regulator [Neoroseomonas nitratireducens]